MKNFCPKLVEVLRKGYDKDKFRRDTLAGMTVAVVSIPLAMALAIASGVTPAQGLYTAIVAGFSLPCSAVQNTKSAARPALSSSSF